jgi:hypothetical protein
VSQNNRGHRDRAAEAGRVVNHNYRGQSETGQPRLHTIDLNPHFELLTTLLMLLRENRNVRQKPDLHNEI